MRRSSSGTNSRRLQLLGEQDVVVDVNETDGEALALVLDGDMAEELEALRRIHVGIARRLLEHHGGPEGGVEGVGPECAGVNGPGDELPERIEVLELRVRRVVVVGGAVVDVGRHPDDVLDAANSGKEPSDLELA